MHSASNLYSTSGANEETLQALDRLASLPAPTIDLNSMPPRRVAAVLVLLHVTSTGDLAVTLTTRSHRLRSHPGDTALPGGRVDLTDDTVVSAALREANEEIGLPLDDMNSLGYLTTLSPFVSRNLLVVYPVLYVYLAPASSLLPRLVANADEVAAIFHLPLKHVLDPSLDGAEGDEKLVYSFQDVRWINASIYRWHAFRHPSLPSPLTGLTADIVLAVAVDAYGTQTPSFGPVQAPGQEAWEILVEWALTGMGGRAGDDHSLVRQNQS